MDETPLVSIIIPAFNVAMVISQSLDSVLAQTYANYEVIIVNDGSTDGTSVVAEKYCGRDARFHLFSGPHIGLSAVRNRAMEKAVGRFIAFLDADDAWHPEKLALQVALFQKNSTVDFIFTNFYMWDGQNDVRLQHKPIAAWQTPDGMAKAVIFRNPICLSTVMAKRDIFSNTSGFDPAIHYCEDRDLWLRLIENDAVFYFLPQPLVRYRQWSGNISKNALGMAEGRIAVLEKNLRLSRHPKWIRWYKASLAMWRSKLEITRARLTVKSEPQLISRRLWRAWRFQPTRLEWLLWYLLAAWPKILGGRATRRIVKRRLQEKNRTRPV